MILNRYDKKVLTIVTLLTLSVILVLALVKIFTAFVVGTLWFMPVGWFVGAVMVWGYGKYNARLTQR